MDGYPRPFVYFLITQIAPFIKIHMTIKANPEKRPISAAILKIANPASVVNCADASKTKPAYNKNTINPSNIRKMVNRRMLAQLT